MIQQHTRILLLILVGVVSPILAMNDGEPVRDRPLPCLHILMNDGEPTCLHIAGDEVEELEKVRDRLLDGFNSRAAKAKAAPRCKRNPTASEQAFAANLARGFERERQRKEPAQAAPHVKKSQKHEKSSRVGQPLLARTELSEFERNIARGFAKAISRPDKAAPTQDGKAQREQLSDLVSGLAEAFFMPENRHEEQDGGGVANADQQANQRNARAGATQEKNDSDVVERAINRILCGGEGVQPSAIVLKDGNLVDMGGKEALNYFAQKKGVPAPFPGY